MSGYQVEFPDFDPETMPAIPGGFADWSWHNDACPSFGNVALGLQIYIDFADVKMREMPMAGRFAVFTLDAQGCLNSDEAVLVADDWQAIMDWLEEFAAKAKPKPVPRP